jgi:hypothetical protein
VLFFIDESWQNIGAHEVGALGGVVVPEPRYNHFCGEVFGIKRDVLGAKELIDCELRGTSCFAKSAFRKREATGHSRLLEAAEKTFDAIEKHKGRVFLIWTSDPTLSLLNNPNTSELSKPYKQLLFDMRALMRNEAPNLRGALTFDQRHHREDEAAACAISNYLFRARRLVKAVHSDPQFHLKRYQPRTASCGLGGPFGTPSLRSLSAPRAGAVRRANQEHALRVSERPAATPGQDHSPRRLNEEERGRRAEAL